MNRFVSIAAASIASCLLVIVALAILPVVALLVAIPITIARRKVAQLRVDLLNGDAKGTARGGGPSNGSVIETTYTISDT